MRTSNAELLAELDTLEEIKRVDSNELEVVKYIEKLEAKVVKQETMINKAVEAVHNNDELSMGYDVLCALGHEC